VTFFYRYTQTVREGVGAAVEMDIENYRCRKASIKPNGGTKQ
jgi:hypothetical protein